MEVLVKSFIPVVSMTLAGLRTIMVCGGSEGISGIAESELRMQKLVGSLQTPTVWLLSVFNFNYCTVLCFW